MEIFLYPQHPFRFFTAPPECGKSYFLTNLSIKIINEYEKLYIYSPSVHQGLCRNLNKCFRIYIPIHIISTTLNEKDIDV